jgi:hypothetical protein
MQGYKSAVLWYHALCKQGFEALEEEPADPSLNKETLNDAWDRVMKGYKKIITDKNEGGIMSVTHSIRKGAATYLLSLIDRPSAIMVYLRAGWSLGNVPDRYIHAGTGSKQLVGRTVALLPNPTSRSTIR